MRLKINLALGLAGLAAAGAAWLHHSGEVSGRAEVQQRWDAETAVRAKTAIRAFEQNAAIGEARDKTQAEIANATEKRNLRTSVAAAGAAVAGDGLRQRFAAVAATCGAATPNPPDGGAAPPTSTTGDLLADVQRRIDEAAGVVAVFADAAHSAGLGCQRERDALTDGAQPEVAP
jgi:hypothetical protein